MTNEHREEIMNFIRQYRSNETNFEKLYLKLEEELLDKDVDTEYVASLLELKEKQAVTYRQAKKEGISAWPEFENFVSGFEKTVTGH